MQVLSRHRALGALASLFAAAFAALPLDAVAQASPGTILLTRPMSATINGHKAFTGSALFSIGDDGFGLRQLTPYAEGVFNIPDAWTEPFELVLNWNGNAFSPSGRYSVYLEAHSSSLPQNGQRYEYGKYFIVNEFGQRTPALFPGGDDLQPPKFGPSYGSVSWGPAGTDRIAYGNSVNGKMVPHACVYLIHPDGTGNRKLWCARGYYPQYYQAIEGIRWSGDGSSLLVYAALRDVSHPRKVLGGDLYRVDVPAGTATLVQANTTPPQHGAGGDVSYDGHEVLYQTNAPATCTPEQSEQHVPCAKNMLTGQQAALVDPDGVLTFGGGQMLLTPDGSKAVLTGIDPLSAVAELYLANTDGTALRKITQPCVPLDPQTLNEEIWAPVRISPDGTRLLANCYVYQDEGSANAHQQVRVYVINLIDGSARYVTNGIAYDWHVPAT